MKSLFLFLFLVSYTLSADQWEILKRADITGDINCIVQNNQSFYICADQFYKMISEDIRPLSENKFQNIAISDNAIFAIKSKDKNIYCSKDDGLTWNQFCSGEISLNWNGIHAESDLKATAFGDALFTTDDGGAHWVIDETTPEYSQAVYLDYFQLTNNTKIILTKNNETGSIAIYRKPPDSLRWNLQYQSEKKYSHGTFHFYDDVVGWFLLGSSTGGDSLYMTADSGKTWKGVYYAGNQDIRINQIFFLNEHEGWACGTSKSSGQPLLCSTSDGGFFWKTESRLSYSPNSLLHIQDSSFIIGEDYGIIEKFDKNISLLTSNGESLRYCDMEIISSHTAIIGNKDLKNLFFLSNQEFNDKSAPFLPQNLLFIDSLLGFGTSSSGKSIYLTKDGGNHWSVFSNEFSSSWRDFVSCSSQVWLLGDSLLFSPDLGSSWEDISHELPYNMLINKGQIVDSYLYIIGVNETNKETCLLYKNKSSDFFKEIFSCSGYFYDFFFLNQKTGWIGNRNKLYHICDSTNNWKVISQLPSGQYINTLLFLDNKTGWIGTDEGQIYKTSDGGYLLELEHQSNSSITSIKYFNNHIIAIGENGFIGKKKICSSLNNINKGWNLFSFPGIITNNDPDHYFKMNCQFWKWLNSEKIFQKTKTIHSHQGLAVHSDSSCLIKTITEFPDSVLTFSLESSLSEQPTFQLVGNPYPFPIILTENSDLFQNPDLYPNFWTYEQDGFRFFPSFIQDMTIDPGQAFWILAKNNGTITFSINRNMNNENFIHPESELRIGFMKNSEPVAYYSIGNSSNASDSIDVYDVLLPPAFPETQPIFALENKDSILYQRIIHKKDTSWNGFISLEKSCTVTFFSTLHWLKTIH